jgi:replication factor A1
MVVNPEIPEARQLYFWKSQYPNDNYPTTTALSNSSSGPGGSVDPLEKRKAVSAIKEEGLGVSEKPDFITIKGSVNYIKHDTDCWYNACPSAGINGS